MVTAITKITIYTESICFYKCSNSFKDGAILSISNVIKNSMFPPIISKKEQKLIYIYIYIYIYI